MENIKSNLTEYSIQAVNKSWDIEDWELETERKVFNFIDHHQEIDFTTCLIAN